MRNVILRVIQLVLEGAALLHRQGVRLSAELVTDHLNHCVDTCRYLDILHVYVCRYLDI